VAPPGGAGASAATTAAQEAARAAVEAKAANPDRGASAGMVGGAIPNVAGQRPPSPPVPNQVSNPPQAPQVQRNAPAPPAPPGAPASSLPPGAPAPPMPPGHAATPKAGSRPAVVNQPPANATPPALGVGGVPGMSVITPDVRVVNDAGWDWRQQLAKADPVLMWAFRVSAIIAVCSLGYILFALFGGSAASPEAFSNPETAAKAATFARDIKTVSVVLHWSLLVTALTMLLLALDVAWIGPTLAGLGFLLHFAAPAALKGLGITPATANVAVTLRSTGIFLLVIGLTKYSFDLYRWLQELPNRLKARADVGSAHLAEAKQQRLAKSATVFSPCWSLPFCREVIRVQCPAFLARTKCWKFGRGCYCDEEMIGRIIRGESLEKIKAPTRMSSQKPPCGRCHIFLEHQGLKYKMAAPMAVPATAAIMFGIWPIFSSVFTAFSMRLEVLWSSISFDTRSITPEAVRAAEGTGTGAPAVSQLSPEKTAEYGMWIFGILLGFFLLIYISKGIEWAILKMKW
jgi:hypothetical protein